MPEVRSGGFWVITGVDSSLGPPASSLCKQIKATRSDDPQLDPQLDLPFPQEAPGSCYLAWWWWWWWGGLTTCKNI